PAAKEQRKAAGRCASPAGTVLVREKSQPAWRVAKSSEELSSTDLLLALPGEKALLEDKSGVVRLTLWGNLPAFSSVPVLESAVLLTANPVGDLEFTLDRGRVVVTNRKPSGSATVRVHVRDVPWDLVLDQAGAEVALELYSRWAPGAPFKLKPEADDVPAAA